MRSEPFKHRLLRPLKSRAQKRTNSVLRCVLCGDVEAVEVRLPPRWPRIRKLITPVEIDAVLD